MGNRIKKARKLNSLTQEQLAKALNVGRTTVTMWETSSQNPDAETLKRLSKVLHVPIDYFVGAGVFENWEEIMENKELVYQSLQDFIPGSYEDIMAPRHNLIAQLDIAFFYDHNELFLIQWFSCSVESVEFLGEGNVDITFTPQFRSAIYIYLESKKSWGVYPIGDIVNSKLREIQQEEYVREKTIDVVKIPVLGSIPAGIPLEAIEDILDWEEIPAAMCDGGLEYFALRVVGDSMWPDFLDGDVVIVRKSPICNSGDVCVVYVNGYDATLKQVKLHENGSLTIIPKNQSYPPRTFSSEEVQRLSVSIAGVVVELRRKMQKTW